MSSHLCWRTRVGVVLVALCSSAVVPGRALAAATNQAQEQAAHAEAAQPHTPAQSEAPDAARQDGAPAARSAGQAGPAGLPPITDEDRRAAFPELDGQHTVHDDAVFTYVLFDQLEWRSGTDGAGVGWETTGWIGGDVSRFWFRTEGEAEDGDLGEAEAHALYGRAIARWWDLVLGARQDAHPGPARTWAAVGLQGLAPYWFEVEATAYIGESGRTHVRLESEYELLLTNRLVLQPMVEVDIYGKADPGRGIGAGLSSMDAGLRLRYEIRREFAPYVGVTWSRRFFDTADLATAEGEDPSAARLALGLRLWF
jgi:copper resistance protein B